MPVEEIGPEELAQALSSAQRPHLLDVRTEGEFQLARIEGSVLIPLHELEERVEEVQALGDREIVVVCHHGVRSLHGAAFANALGLKAKSLHGGIDLWSIVVDPKVPRY